MKRTNLKLYPATIGEARALLGLENRSNEWAAKRRRARRERKAESRARFHRRQQLRKQLAQMKRARWPHERHWIKGIIGQMPPLPSLFTSEHYKRTSGFEWPLVREKDEGSEGDVRLERTQITYPKLALAEPLTEEQIAQLRQMVNEKHERLSRALFLGVELPWLRDANPLKDSK